MRNKIDRTGEIGLNKYNRKMIITEYVTTHDVLVEFDNGYKVRTEYKHFKNGEISNPYDKSVLGMGYIGEGDYKVKINRKHTIQYLYWRSMLQRCYDLRYKNKHLTYTEAICCKEWLDFQKFSKWFDDNYYTIDYVQMNLDKDILHKGNKIYSPENCVFVPHYLNKLFIKCDKSRGDYPIGVSWNKGVNKFSAQMRKDNKKVLLGLFDNPIEAFDTYKKTKEKYIKQEAEKYKNKIPILLYQAMYNYKVEITD